MTINFYLRNPKKDGVCAIYASICYDNNRLIVFPGEKVHTGDWINKEGKKNEPKASAKNGTLIGNLFKAEKLYRDTYEDLKVKLGGIVPADIFKKAIADKKNPQVVKVVKPVRFRIVDFFKKTIDETISGERLSNKKMKLQTGSIKPYNSVYSGFEAFEFHKGRTYYMDEISQKLIDDFDRYLTQVKKLALNTKSKYLKTIMLMLRYGVEKKVVGVTVAVMLYDVAGSNSEEWEGDCSLLFEQPMHIASAIATEKKGVVIFIKSVLVSNTDVGITVNVSDAMYLYSSYSRQMGRRTRSGRAGQFLQ